VGNHLRALLGEYGLVVGQGAGALSRAVPELLEQPDNGLSALGRELVAELWAHWQGLHRQAQGAERRVARWAHAREDCRRLMSIPGIGPVNAVALVAYVGDARRFGNARALSASLGLVPRQHSSGAQRRLLGITKHGDKHLRALLIHGARAALVRMAGKSDRLSRWACALVARRGFNRAVVALANKLARIAWALLLGRQTYQAQP
jgi:transposase